MRRLLGHTLVAAYRKSGATFGAALAEQWWHNVDAGNCRYGETFEEWLPIVAGGDFQAEIAGKKRYAEIREERKRQT